ncbi:MAG: alpha-ketoglutarate-dependent dioxygenase AlkB [Pseudomonadota bacterium]
MAEICAVSSIGGLAYIPYFIIREQSDALCAKLDAMPWDETLKRRTQHFGFRYDYKARSVLPESYLGPLPDWLDDLARRLHDAGWFPAAPTQVIANEYLPGQGISAHVDCEPCFGPVIASLSLLSACEMVFRHKSSGQKVSMVLKPGSLLVMADDARFEWTHEIPARKSDFIEGMRVPRSRRISLTFRNVIQA